MPITDDERSDLHEILRLLDDAYEHYFKHSAGYRKSSEGLVEVSFGDCSSRDGDPLRIRRISIYSCVFGLLSCHDFLTTAEALTTVRRWHAREFNDAIRP